MHSLYREGTEMKDVPSKMCPHKLKGKGIDVLNILTATLLLQQERMRAGKKFIERMPERHKKIEIRNGINYVKRKSMPLHVLCLCSFLIKKVMRSVRKLHVQFQCKKAVQMLDQDYKNIYFPRM